MEYRVEQKYFVTEDTIAYLMKRLECCMQYDANAGKDGYLIRSIYFDDMYDTCYNENESGVDPREKFRIRTYNASDETIHLELKSKYRGYTKKQAESISRKKCELFMENKAVDHAYILSEPIDGEAQKACDQNHFLQKKLYAKYLLTRMQPVCVIEYERIAFVDPIGNVRITFDRNIGVSERIESFFDERIMATPVLPVGMHILEVKYDEFLPDLYKSILKECSLRRTTFSKYYCGRLALNQEPVL